jgi:hypothetical protein
VQQGPFNLKQLEGKNITSNTTVWYDPLPKWTTAGEVAALKNIINKTVAPPHPMAATAAKEEDWSNKQFYFMDSAGVQQGPFNLKQLEGKNITSNTTIWYDPLPKWTTAGEVAALKNIINKPVMAPHPVAAPATATKEEDLNYKQFYFIDSAGVQQGPFNIRQLEGKNITSNTAVWYDPLPKWTTAGEVTVLKNIINKAVTAPHPVATTAAKEEDWNNKQYFFMDSAGVRQGPFNLKQLEGKNITLNTAVWYDPLPKWTTAGEVTVLKNIINKAVTAPHPVATTAAKEEDWNNKQYFFADSAGVQQGPFNLEQLKGKNITTGTPVWYPPLPNWTTAGEVAALKDIINKPTPAS